MDSSVMQFIGLRYTEPDMTVSYPGFLYLMIKLDSMIRNGGKLGKTHGGGRERERERDRERERAYGRLVWPSNQS